MKLFELLESPSEYVAHQHLSSRPGSQSTESALSRAGIKFVRQRGPRRIRYVINKNDLSKANAVTHGRARVVGPDIAAIDDPIQ